MKYDHYSIESMRSRLASHETDVKYHTNCAEQLRKLISELNENHRKSAPVAYNTWLPMEFARFDGSWQLLSAGPDVASASHTGMALCRYHRGHWHTESGAEYMFPKYVYPIAGLPDEVEQAA